MASFNQVVLVGHLTRDVETRSFGNGGMVSKFGFAVNGRKKNQQTQQWEDEPMYIDCEAYNRGENGKLADQVRDFCRKGSKILIEGRLDLDEWDDKATGAKRSKHKVVVSQMQLLDAKQVGGGQRVPAPSGRSGGGYDAPPSDSGNKEDIPF